MGLNGAGLIRERHVRVQRQEPEVQDTSTDHDEVQVVPKPELEGVDGEEANLHILSGVPAEHGRLRVLGIPVRVLCVAARAHGPQ